MDDRKKIALVVPPSSYSAPIGWEVAARAPLEGATIAGTVLLKAGFDVLGYDLRVLHDGQRHLLDNLDGLSAICITGTPNSFPFVKQFSHVVAQRRPHLRMILGGPLATYSHDTVLRTTNIRECIIGDCERSLPAVMLAPSLDGLESKYYVAYKTGRKIIKNAPPTMPGIDMNDELVPRPEYRQVWKRTYGEGYTPRLVYYATQRGCGFRCTFCAENRTVSSAGYDRLFADILHLAKDQGVRELFFSDPTFNTSEEHCRTVIHVLAAVRKVCPELEWSCQVRAVMPVKRNAQPMPIPKELLHEMRGVGCKAVFVGIESAATKLLTLVDKKITISNVKETVQRANSEGLEVHGFLMLGLPGENDDTLQETLSLVYNSAFFPRVRYAMPLPTTKLFIEELDARGAKRLSRKARQFEEEVLTKMANWQNTPLDEPFPLMLRTESPRIADAMRLMSWRFLELPDTDQSRFAKHKRTIEDRFHRWLDHHDMSVKPLFFPNPKTEQLIGMRLKAAIQTVVSQEILGRNQGIRIKRILVHGSIPHLVWSSSEVYRPVYFFFGALSRKCEECQMENLIAQGENPAAIVSSHWRRQVLRFRDGPKVADIPQCWSQSFLSKPDAAACAPSDCPFAGGKHEEGAWSALDVLTLSRMRLRPWALRKREILQTPAASSETKRSELLLYSPSALGGVNQIDNVSVASLVRRPLDNKDQRASARRNYVHTFASESWRTSAIFAGPHKGTNGKSTSAQKAWDDNWVNADNDDATNNSFHLLSQDRSVFLKADGTPCWQGALAIADVSSDVFIYFEIEESEAVAKGWEEHFVNDVSASVALQDDASIVAAGHMGDKRRARRQLINLCDGSLLPWIDLMKTADERWENHQAIEGVFPMQMQNALLALDWHPGSECDSDTFHAQTSSTVRAEGLYCRRIRQEEAPPVKLALALMGDMWKFSFKDILNPHYTDFERFQQLLKAIPDYRDHLTHSIQVYLLGNRIIDCIAATYPGAGVLRLPERYGKALHESISEKIKADELRTLRFQWALASLMHDFALPAAKANEVVGHLFETFLGISAKGQHHGSDGLKDVLDQEEKKHRGFLLALMSMTEIGAKLSRGAQNGAQLQIANEVIYRGLYEDHGFLSAIYLFNQLFEKNLDWWELRDPVRKELAGMVEVPNDKRYQKRLSEGLILEVMDAIVKHNAFNKEYQMAFDDPPLYKFPSTFFSASNSICLGPLPALLLLCDNLCDWGRVIHADDLKQHDSTGAAPTSEVQRPECQLTDIRLACPSTASEDDVYVNITAQYYWRLPVTHSLPRRASCLAYIYDELRREMDPYTPGFSLWKGCDACSQRNAAREMQERDMTKCRAVEALQRFWTRVVSTTCVKENRLKFPPQYFGKTFNKIRLTVTFYDQFLCEGTVGDGFAIKDGVVNPCD